MSVLSDTGRQSLSVRYSAYGVPFGSPAGDLNADGAVNFTDSTQIASWISGSVYDVRADINLDGAVDSTDQTLLAGANFGVTLGRGKLAAGQTSSAWAPGVRKGYAGYEHDGVVNSVMHVRNRVLLGELGRWSRRDPLGYVDSMDLYEYVMSSPIRLLDSQGLWFLLPPGTLPPEDIRNGGFGGGGGGEGGNAGSAGGHAGVGIGGGVIGGGGGSPRLPPSSSTPDCNDGSYCWDTYQTRMLTTASSAITCAVQAGAILTSPSNIRDIVLCAVGCLFLGPFAPACEAACGLATSIPFFLDWYGCIQRQREMASSALWSYCGCLEWKQRNCSGFLGRDGWDNSAGSACSSSAGPPGYTGPGGVPTPQPPSPSPPVP